MRKDKIEIYGVLQGLRNNCDYTTVANSLLKATIKQMGEPHKLRRLSLEESKSLLICLALDALEKGKRADILLCAWALLKDYEYGKNLTQRRKHYLEQREKYVPDFINKQPFASLSTTKQKIRADALRGKEDKYCLVIEKYYNDLPEKLEYIQKASKKFIVVDTTGDIEDPVKYPTPSYIINAHQSPNIGTEIENNNVSVSNDWFYGRNNELKKIEENFNNDNHIQIIFGVSGVGKTRLAYEYAYRHKSKYNDVFWIDASTPELIRKSCTDIIRYHNRYESSNVEIDDIESEFKKLLENYETYLIIFNNANYLTEYTDENIAKTNYLKRYILSESGDIIITTTCEQCFDWAESVKVDIFNHVLSVDYLETITGLPKDNYTELLASELCDLPLALEYAGIYIKNQHISYADYLKLWKQIENSVPHYKSDAENAIIRAVTVSLCVTDKNFSLYNEVELVLFIASLIKEQFIPIKMFANCTNNLSLQLLFRDNAIYDDVIAFLTDYSLAVRHDDQIYIHPLLKNVFYDRVISENNIRYLYKKSSIKYYIATTYWINNTVEIAKQYALEAFSDLEKSPEKISDIETAAIIKAVSKNMPLFMSMMDEFLAKCDESSVIKAKKLRQFIFNSINGFPESDNIRDTYLKIDFNFLSRIATVLDRCLITRRLPFWKDQTEPNSEYSYLISPTNQKLSVISNEALKLFVDFWIDGNTFAIKALKKYYSNTEDCFQIIALPKELNDEKNLSKFKDKVHRLP